MLINSQKKHNESAKMHSWDDFKYFLSVVETGSFSAAAKQLSVNHSTVSRRIQVLESSHGVRLLERTQSGYQMTEAGASIFEIAQDLKNSTLKASRILQGRDARLEGEINLTMPHDIFDYLLVSPLREFGILHPNIQFNMLVSKGLRNMANREADLAVRITANPPDYLIGSRLTTLQHAFYTSDAVSLDKKTPLVVWEGQKELPHWASEHFISPYIALRVDDLASMYRAVKAGFGIARMPCFLPDAINLEEQKQSGTQSLKRMNIEIPRSNWGVWLLSHEDLRNSARINACRQFIKKTLVNKIDLFTGKYSEISTIK
ncbi:LysR family transcriptional regulator [Algibacillus agarilyticus]|uniref:LysR family transcriptional regulator n=1 Tax=Algibacillus agarilyticus TaxID=2234133 RepID=UPI001E4B750A|nr:LysR family transcriptional regulator [Algibacillus agarilyticus]